MNVSLYNISISLDMNSSLFLLFQINIFVSFIFHRKIKLWKSYFCMLAYNYQYQHSLLSPSFSLSDSQTLQNEHIFQICSPIAWVILVPGLLKQSRALSLLSHLGLDFWFLFCLFHSLSLTVNLCILEALSPFSGGELNNKKTGFVFLIAGYCGYFVYNIFSNQGLALPKKILFNIFSNQGLASQRKFY